LTDKSFIIPRQTAHSGQPEFVPETKNAGVSASLHTIRIPAHPPRIISSQVVQRVIDPMCRADAVENMKGDEKRMQLRNISVVLLALLLAGMAMVPMVSAAAQVDTSENQDKNY
jgi:hypothetical protein